MASRKSGAKHASRPAVKHLSHNHPLRLSKSKEDEEIICSGCELDLIGPAYKCTKSDCDYFLHKSCFQLSHELHHKSHTAHPLTLLYSPPFDQSILTCDACGEYGTGFNYHCSTCQYVLHIGCVSMPEAIERDDHEHPLTLFYSSPFKEDGSVFKCDMCEENVPENFWVYYCQECDYGTHLLSCAADEDDDQEEEDENDDEEEEEEGEKAEQPRKFSRKKRVDPEEAVSSATDTLSSMIEAQQQMSRLQFQTQMAMQQAQMIRDMGRSMVNLVS